MGGPIGVDIAGGVGELAKQRNPAGRRPAALGHETQRVLCDRPRSAGQQRRGPCLPAGRVSRQALDQGGGGGTCGGHGQQTTKIGGRAGEHRLEFAAAFPVARAHLTRRVHEAP